jgi:hypothetical protein
MAQTQTRNSTIIARLDRTIQYASAPVLFSGAVITGCLRSWA